PLLLNVEGGGEPWRSHGITGDRVRDANRHMGLASSTLWEHAQRLLDEAESTGVLEPGPAEPA
ncbi:hypothetical protein B7486_78685, partial [cyanobacterium TDX16]